LTRTEYHREQKRRKRLDPAYRARERANDAKRHKERMASDPAYAEACRERWRRQSAAASGTEANRTYQRDYKRCRRLELGKPVRPPEWGSKVKRTRALAGTSVTMSASEKGRLGAAARWADHVPAARPRRAPAEVRSLWSRADFCSLIRVKYPTAAALDAAFLAGELTVKP
jgi:hypothetical protein